MIGEIHEDGGQPDIARDTQGRLHVTGSALYVGVRYEVTAISGHGVAGAVADVLPDRETQSEPESEQSSGQ